MARAIGIDLGGTKIETQVFAEDWSVSHRQRIDTPQDYDALVAAMAGQIAWATGQDGTVPVGIGAAGLVSPITGEALTANLPATGRTFPADIEKAAGLTVTYVNDCRALTLSEAVFGVAQGLTPVVGLILGTGVGGGVAVNGVLVEGPGLFAGEFGHLPLPADQIDRYDLPLVTCGCGRRGCVETLISGPGLTRLAQHLTGLTLSPPEIASGRDSNPEVARIWQVWCELVADLLRTISLVTDPKAIVLGGGLSRIEGVANALFAATQNQMWAGYPAPEILIAEGGDASGARGAAYAAWRAGE